MASKDDNAKWALGKMISLIFTLLWMLSLSVLNIVIGIIVMIYGWGLQAESWFFIIGGAVFMFISSLFHGSSVSKFSKITAEMHIKEKELNNEG